MRNKVFYYGFSGLGGLPGASLSIFNRTLLNSSSALINFTTF